MHYKVFAREEKDGYRYKIHGDYVKTKVVFTSKYVYNTEKSAKSAAWRFLEKNGF